MSWSQWAGGIHVLTVARLGLQCITQEPDLIGRIDGGLCVCTAQTGAMWLCRQDLKELKFRPSTDVHDYQVRLRSAQKFIAKVRHPCFSGRSR